MESWVELATDIGNVSESSQGDQLTTVATDIVGAINELETNINDAITSSISWTLAGDSGSSQSIVGGNTATFTGGTGIDTTASATDTITLAIDSTVATLTGSQTLTNKTLTTPRFNNYFRRNNRYRVRCWWWRCIL